MQRRNAQKINRDETHRGDTKMKHTDGTRRGGAQKICTEETHGRET